MRGDEIIPGSGSQLYNIYVIQATKIDPCSEPHPRKVVGRGGILYEIHLEVIRSHHQGACVGGEDKWYQYNDSSKSMIVDTTAKVYFFWISDPIESQ
jgi:hypothetical protein